MTMLTLQPRGSQPSSGTIVPKVRHAMTDLRRLPGPDQDHWGWQQDGACRGSDNAVFFHPDFERGTNRDARAAAAKAVCAQCPVLRQCREHALTVQEAYGTWGGLDELERKIIFKTMRQSKRVTG